MAEKNTEADKRLKELEKSVTAYIAEIGRLQARLGELSGEVGLLRGELYRKRGVRPAASALYHAIDKAVTIRLERRGYTRKPSRRSRIISIPAKVLESGDPAELEYVARQYDARVYFRARASKSGMRLGYRIASGVYGVLRDTGVAGLKRAYSLVKRGRK